MKSTPKSPRLHPALAFPLRMAPARLHGALAARMLERVFAEQRTAGELDFLEGRGVRIRVLDAGIDLCLSAGPHGLESLPVERPLANRAVRPESSRQRTSSVSLLRLLADRHQRKVR